ncbi:hypothetical protein B296_00008947 [Ensete ventricosum]|uniref:Uncharacterized protein n=1 Tax=Ensete ventricosum TaxID=4639 RepID=A0A427B0Z4_ENSVE|nr:hypothetical protein B296_00008947 [Ensete ventricosum]
MSCELSQASTDAMLLSAMAGNSRRVSPGWGGGGALEGVDWRRELATAVSESRLLLWDCCGLGMDVGSHVPMGASYCMVARVTAA